MRRRRKEKLSRKQRRIKNRVTFRTLFLLSITLIFNTYAWFLYVNTVSSNLTAHVDAWQVQFQVDQQVVETQFTFNVPHAYPGMTEVSKAVSIVNQGERVADIDYQIMSYRIFNQNYISSEAIAEGATAPQGATTMTAAQLLTKLQNDYPFVISFTKSSNSINVGQQGTLTIAFNWAYESGNDANDTSYGTTAYTYYSNNQGSNALEVVIKIIAEQHNS